MPLIDDPARMRRIMLWVMLGTLTASGLLAVLGVLGTDTDQMSRIVGTGISAAIASALLLAACKFLDSQTYRRTGLFLMALIVVQFVLTMVAFWDPLRITNVIPRYRSDETLGFTALTFPLAAIPAAIFFHVIQFKGAQLAGIVGIALCAATYSFFLLACWISIFSDNSGTYENDFWVTGWACWLLAFAAAASTAGIGINRHHWRWIGLFFSLVAFATGLFEQWAGTNAWSNLFIISTTVGAIIAHANVLWLCKLSQRQDWLRLLTVICAGLAGAIFDYAAIKQLNNFDPTWRLGMAAAICAACGTVAVAILAVFNRKPIPVSSAIIDAKDISVICPVCRKKQSVPIANGNGESNCPGCGVQFSIHIRAPRCPTCGYMLFMLQSDRCPECGTPTSQTTAVPIPNPA
jgi:hypothetical protein